MRHYYQIMNQGRCGEIYNVGSGCSLSMRELLKQILAENGLPDDVVTTADLPGSEFDVADVYADVSKLNKLYQR